MLLLGKVLGDIILWMWVNCFPSLGLRLSVYKMGRLEDMVSEHGVWSHTDVSLNPGCHFWLCCLGKVA